MAKADRSTTHVRRWEDFSQKTDLPAKARWMAAVVLDERLTTTAKAVAGALAFKYHNSKTGNCTPSYRKLAAEILGPNAATSTAERAVAELRKCGWVSSRIMLKSDGSNGSCTFVLTNVPPEKDKGSGRTGAATTGSIGTATSRSADAASMAAIAQPGGSAAAVETSESNRRNEAGEQTGEKGTIHGDPGGGCAAPAVIVGGLTPSISPARNEYLAGQEGESTGLRTNSAAPAPVGSAFDLPPGMNPPGMSHLARRPGESEADYRLRVNSAITYPSRAPMITPSALLVSWDDQDDDLERRLLAMVQPAS